MSGNFQSALCIAAGVLTLAAVFLNRTMRKIDSREPPSVPPMIPLPYIGHLLGLLWQRNGYYANISQKYDLPIISISMLGGTVYIIGSPELMHHLHRHPQAVSLWSMQAQFTAQLGALSKETSKAMVSNLEPGSQESNIIMMEGLKAMQQSMTPANGMDDMNRVAARVTKARLDELLYSREDRPLDLWEWVQHEITVATTECVYGDKNPYRDPKVESAFCGDFANNTINILIATVTSKIFASKGLTGRETVVHAMQKYFSSNSHLQGSSLVKARYTSMRNNVLSSDIPRLETVNGLAILANTAPIAFWTIVHTFSDPAVLARVRSEVEAITSTAPDGRTKTINLRRLKDAPIVFSIMQEALRYRATGTGPRMIMEDVMIGDNFLKKGSMAIIANKTLHFNKAAWGDDVDHFRADRFCGKVPSYAFRGFGGGVSTCPGKAFAMVEVGSLIAMLAMRFDLKPVNGVWEESGQDTMNMSLQTAPPLKRPLVSFVPRPEMRHLTWDFVL